MAIPSKREVRAPSWSSSSSPDYQCPFCARHFQQTSPPDRARLCQHRSGQICAFATSHRIDPQGRAQSGGGRPLRRASTASTGKCMTGSSTVRTRLPRTICPPTPALWASTSRSFRQCLDNNKYSAKIRQDLVAVQKVGVQATPSFLLGVAEPGGSSVKVVKAIAGAHPYPVFKEAIDSLLASEKPAAPRPVASSGLKPPARERHARR